MSQQTNDQGGRRGTVVAAVATLVLVVIGVVALTLGLHGHEAPAAPVAGGSPSTSVSATPTPPAATPSEGPTKGGRSAGSTDAATDAGPTFGDVLPASQPTRITIPSIGLSSDTFVELSVQKDGTLSVPGTENEVGLYADGPTPGQLGPAVIGAHVDSPEGRRGIFFELGKVRAGDTVEIDRKDGANVVFTVDRVKAYKKSEFPTDLVYRGSFDRSEIRLVTCGGPVDSANEYRDNVVVFGHLTSVSGGA